ncbi:MAG: calcium/sodium antiporter [Xanthomonadales bacterium]|nr:calcium/sodium antiporter [Xanthomonadales bacterium]
MINTVTIFLAGLVLLYAGGESLVRGAASLGLRLGMTPLVVGLTIVAFATSAPELLVTTQAALQGEGGLAVGNVVGSNICNIGLILGITTLVRPTRIDVKLVRLDVPVMLGASVLLALLLIDSRVTRIEGTLLLLGLVSYMAYTVYQSRKAGRWEQQEFEESVPQEHSTILSVIQVVGGVLLLVYGGKLFVDGAVDIAASLGVPAAIIGLSVVSIGTSIPELATSIVAAVRGHSDLAAGNLVGSNIFNVCSVLGLTALVSPLDAGQVTWIDLGVMLAASALTMRLMFTAARIERWEGGILLLGYLTYLTWLFV